ncbi:hypothetical protein PG995_012885 [Apiospora arundinis]
MQTDQWTLSVYQFTNPHPSAPPPPDSHQPLPCPQQPSPPPSPIPEPHPRPPPSASADSPSSHPHTPPLLDEQEGRDGRDAVASRDVGHGVNVHFREGDTPLAGVLRRVLVEEGGHGLAGAAPGRVEVDDGVGVGGEQGVELAGAVDGRDLGSSVVVGRHL